MVMQNERTRSAALRRAACSSTCAAASAALGMAPAPAVGPGMREKMRLVRSREVLIVWPHILRAAT